jgi:serine/threonine-protein kinase
VADFGIASAAGLTALTETGSVLGTFGYLAPEQAAGTTAGPAADRYALGVVAYELLAGRRPFEGDTGAGEALAAGRDPVPPISQLRHGLPSRLDAVFERALAKDPAERHSSCAELVGDLRRAFADDAEPTRVRTAPPAQHVSARRGGFLPWAIAVVLLAGAGVAAAVLLTRGDGGRPAPPRSAVRTITAQGSTVTVTASAPTTAPRAPTTAPASASSASGSSLNDSGYRRMQAGDYRGALPLLVQAVERLQGSGSLSEAYASYNLAFTRFALGSCDGVLALLDRSQAVQGHRSEIDSLRRRAQPKCG